MNLGAREEGYAVPASYKTPTMILIYIIRVGHPLYASDTHYTRRTPTMRVGHPLYASDTHYTRRTPTIRNEHK